MSEIKIFLASSSALKAEREQFEIFVRRRNDLWRARNIVLRLVVWEDFRSSMSVDGSQSEYNKAIESCNIFVALIHNKVGKYTLEEFNCAYEQLRKANNLFIYTYLKKPRTTEEEEDWQSLWAFEKQLKQLKHYPTDYHSLEELREDFGNQLDKLAADGSLGSLAEAELLKSKGVMDNYSRPLQMPPLPDHFVERPEPQNAVKAQLLCDNDKGGTLVVSAIYGLGGIGKSVLASKLTHDADVQDYFADGILWVTLGQNPDILPLLSGWIQALGDYDYKPTAIESAANHLRTLLYDKCILLVVDDVWNPAHLEPFRVGGEKSRVMVTTREARIPDAQLHSLDVMDEAQALDLMTQKIKEPLSDKAQRQALEFAGRVGYLPLALELAASQIEDGVRWQELLDDFTAEVARLESLDIYGQGEMPDEDKRRKYSLLACFNLSLRQLSPEQLRQFAWLGVVPEDVSLTQEMAETLWEVSSRQAGSILRTFRAKSLVLQGAKQQGAQQQDGAQVEERPSYRMHDLMHDLAKQLLQQPVEPEGEDGLPGLGLTVVAAHGELLARYQAKTTPGKDGRRQWHTLTDDGYIFAHLTWHMEQAKRPEEIHRLLCASNKAGRNGWYAACDALGQPAGFVNDMGRAWELAVKSYEAAPGETVALLYRYGLMRASLNSLASNVPAKMVGGLVKAGYWQVAQGLAYAQQAQNPWHRAACISAIVPYMPKALLPEVLKTVGQIKDAAYRSYGLSKVAEHFPMVWPDVLATIKQIEDRYGAHRSQAKGFSHKSLALSRVSKKLPSQYLTNALDISRHIQDMTDRAMAVVTLAGHMPNLRPEALALTHKIKDESSRSRALCSLAEYMPELWPEALAVTREIKDENSRSRALCSLAEHMPELWSEVLSLTCEIEDEYFQSLVLRKISRLLPEAQWPEVLAVTREIKDENSRPRALCSLAEHMPEVQWPEALAITREIKDENSRSRALCSLAEHMPEAQWPEALAITREIKDENSRSRALCSLAEHMPEAQ
ncbi:MAG: NB-ARC domain-containing protein, partial [Cyanobacteria bacterium P01_F01_bin.53]